MAIDASIPLQVQGLKLPDPAEAYGRNLTLRNALLDNQQGQMKLSALQQSQAQAEQLRALLSDPNFNIRDPKQRMGLAKYGEQGMAVGKAFDEQKTAQLTQAKEIHGLLKSTAAFIMANPAMGAQAIAKLGEHTGEDMTAEIAEYNALPDDNAKRQWAAGHAVEADKMLPDFKQVDAGGSQRLGTVDPLTGNFTEKQRIDKTATPGELMSHQDRVAGLGDGGMSGWTPDATELAAQMYVQTGQMPPLGMGKSAMTARSAIMNRAGQIASGKTVAPPTGVNDMADAAGNIRNAKIDTATTAKVAKDFSTGTQGQMVTSFNTAIDHLQTMSELTTALQNGDTRLFNTIGNKIAKETGQPAPTNFDGARQIVGAEIQKAIIRAGGTGAEREEAANAFAQANSPAQLAGTIETYKKLLGGQLKSLNQQYETGTGRKDFANRLTPAARQQMESVQSAPAAPSGLPSGWSVQEH